MESLGTHVLLIDDELDVHVLVRGGLEWRGFQVDCALDAASGVEQAISSPPDLILLDVLMPEVDGFELCERLMGTHETRDVPVIFLTSRNEVSDRVHGLKLGAADYICKPFDIEELEARVQAALRGQRKISAREAQLERLKAYLTSLLAHSVNTPLTLIHGFTDLLDRHLHEVDQETVRQYLRSIRNGSQALQDLVDDFYFLAEQDKVSGSAAMRLDPLVDKAIESLVALRATHQMSVERDLPADLPPVQGHPRYLERAIYHLIANAHHYNPRGGRIRIEGRRDGSRVHLTVQDDGPGVAEPNAELIFGVFQQEEQTLARPHTGLGIGLTVARGVARRLGGDVTLDTVPGAGSRFTLDLPAAVT